ncbi:unnamed protein product [Rhodiola kirilowii]
MQAEYDTLKQSKTWVLVPCPSGANIVGSIWVFSY